jgi:peptidoglycan/LPS O-acetylase OafA/YrhL
MSSDSSAFCVSGVTKFHNINELRLLFALSVLVSHSIQLSQFTSYDILRQIFSSEIAVQGFFILSGFLVFGSYSRILDTRTFYIRRFLRIYPGYVIAVVLFLVLALVQTYLHSKSVQLVEVARYLGVNLLLLNFLQPGIEGVFYASPYHEINGALWTIKIEVMFYAMVPLLYWAGQRWSHRVVAAALIVIGLSWRPMLDWVAAGGNYVHPSFAYQLPGQLHFFGLGVLMFDVSNNRGHRTGNAAIVLVAVSLTSIMGDPRMAMQIALLSLCIYGVTQLPQLSMRLGDLDLSYGVYLSHFPIIQLLIGFGVVDLGAMLFLLLVIFLSTVYAMASWNCVERPALNFSRKILV